MCETSIGEYACRWSCGASSLATRSQRSYSPRPQSGWMPDCMQISRGAVLDRLAHAAAELRLVVLVGVRRALALAEPAEGAADGADVRHVDVAVDDERHRLPRQLRAAARRRPRACPRSPRAASRRTSPSAPAATSASPACARAPLPGRRGPRRMANGASWRPEPPPRDEAPVARLDHVEHALLHPAGVDVLRVDAEALGQRDPVRRQALADLVGRGERDARARCGRRWRSGRRGPSPPRPPASGHQSERLGGIWTPTSGSSRRASRTSRRMSSMSIGVAHSGGRSSGGALRPVRQYSPAASLAMSAGSSP